MLFTLRSCQENSWDAAQKWLADGWSVVPQEKSYSSEATNRHFSTSVCVRIKQAYKMFIYELKRYLKDHMYACQSTCFFLLNWADHLLALILYVRHSPQNWYQYFFKTLGKNAFTRILQQEKAGAWCSINLIYNTRTKAYN